MLEQRRRQRAAYEARANSRAELRGMPRRPGPRTHVRRPVLPSDDEWERAKERAEAAAQAAEAEEQRERQVREQQRRRRQQEATRNGAQGRRNGDDPGESHRQPHGAEAEANGDVADGSSDEDDWYREQLKSRARSYEAEQSKREASAAAEAKAWSEKEGGSECPGGASGAGPRFVSSTEATFNRQRATAAWERFLSQGDKIITMVDVPWPALEASALGLELQRAKAERKKAFRELSLRWHPDRFLQSFGSRLHEEDREAILSKVTEVSQAINALFQEST